jgi:hypothetical protein
LTAWCKADTTFLRIYDKGEMMRRYLLLLLIGNLLMVCGGCVTTAVGTGSGMGVGTYSYISGELEALYVVPIEDLWAKTLTAMEMLRLTIDDKRMDGIGGQISARRADGTIIKVRFESLSNNRTIVGVRVDTFGNKEYSKRIHNAIQNQLGTS